MAEHGRRTAAATVLCFLAAGLVTGCDGDEPAGGPAAASPTPTSQHDGGESVGTNGPSTASALADRRCGRAERNAAGWDWTWRAVDEVAGSASGHSNRARASVERYVATTRSHLQEKCCGTTPQAFRDFSRRIRRILADGSFGDPQLDQVLAAWLRWGTAVGEPGTARRTIREVRSCRRLFTRFEATYRTWWRWTSTGKAWWIDITFENRTAKLQGGSTWTRVKVTERLHDSFGPQGDRGPARVEDAMLQTGASSSDSFNAPPGTTVWRVPLEDIHTTAAGTLRVIQPAFYLLHRHGSCNAPVLPRP